MAEREVAKAHKLTGEEIADKELTSASDALFDEFTQGMRSAFKVALAVNEKWEDTTAGFIGGIFGNEARESHTKKLETKALDEMKAGRIDAAKHFLKRDVAYTIGSQGWDDEDSQRLVKEILLMELMEKRLAEGKAQAQKPYAKSLHTADVFELRK